GISAGIGFIILFGVNTINSIILIAVMKDNLRKLDIKEAVSKGVFDRIRPIVMIALMGSLGLLPASLSSGMGSEIQKPLAIMIVGGLLICMTLSLTVLPQAVDLAYRNKPTKPSEEKRPTHNGGHSCQKHTYPALLAHSCNIDSR